MAANRVFVLGLDGATFELLDPWLEGGLLPNLAAMVEGGYRCTLFSTTPPVTPVAWSSMVTGVNPGRHGIFDFRRREGGSYRFLPVLGRDRKAPGIWSYLSSLGLRSIVVNLPTSYPPEEFNGIMVSGMDTPPSANDFVRPWLDLRQLLGSKGPYIIETTFEPLARGNEQEWLDQMGAMTDARVELVRKLAQEQDWALFWAVFVFPDRLQHVLWKYVDPTHPRHDPTRREWAEGVMLDFWKRVDILMGSLLETLANVNFLAVSDHGFGPYRKLVRVNRLLENMGYLRFTEGGVVDWPSTKAFAVGSHSSIYINLKGREPQGTVEAGDYWRMCEELSQALKETTDADGPLFEFVSHRSEVYRGPYLEEAPDLVLAGRSYNIQVSDGFAHEASSPRAEIIDELMLTDSGHHPSGILVAYGPGISEGSGTVAQITDVMPTVMSLLQVPVPLEVDGEAIKSMVKALQGREPERAAYNLPSARLGPEYSEEQMEEVLGRLRDLGYIE